MFHALWTMRGLTLFVRKIRLLHPWEILFVLDRLTQIWRTRSGIIILVFL